MAKPRLASPESMIDRTIHGRTRDPSRPVILRNPEFDFREEDLRGPIRTLSPAPALALTRLASRKDRDGCIGRYLIGVKGLGQILADSRLKEVPFVLQTTDPDQWATEIELIRNINAGN